MPEEKQVIGSFEGAGNGGDAGTKSAMEVTGRTAVEKAGCSHSDGLGRGSAR